jgi:TonB family protein
MQGLKIFLNEEGGRKKDQLVIFLSLPSSFFIDFSLNPVRTQKVMQGLIIFFNEKGRRKDYQLIILFLCYDMQEYHHKKKFLNLPKYLGGSKAFKEFIAANLRYPKEALEARVEGSVIVGYDVDNNGDVISLHVIKGLGYGCDEEAVRLIGMLSFEKARNKGLRVKISQKTKINFRLPTVSINYSLAEKKVPDKKKNGGTIYEYTIKF